MRLCCKALSRHVAAAGARGFGVVAVRQGEIRWFALQMRAVDHDREVSSDALRGLPTLRMAEQIGIKFCPHCGADLSALIAADVVGFDRLVLQSASLQLGPR